MYVCVLYSLSPSLGSEGQIDLVSAFDAYALRSLVVVPVPALVAGALSTFSAVFRRTPHHYYYHYYSFLPSSSSTSFFGVVSSSSFPPTRLIGPPAIVAPGAPFLAGGFSSDAPSYLIF